MRDIAEFLKVLVVAGDRERGALWRRFGADMVVWSRETTGRLLVAARSLTGSGGHARVGIPARRPRTRRRPQFATLARRLDAGQGLQRRDGRLVACRQQDSWPRKPHCFTSIVDGFIDHGRNVFHFVAPTAGPRVAVETQPSQHRSVAAVNLVHRGDHLA